LRGRLAKLASSTPGGLDDLARGLPDPDHWVLTDLCGGASAQARSDFKAGDPTDEKTARYQPAIALLEQCSAAALTLSDSLSRRYFSHADAGSQSLGA
jgi:hypothetical protein